MSNRLVQLTGPIGLVPSLGFHDTVLKQQRRYRYLPGIADIVNDLYTLARRGPIPARVAPGRSGRPDYLKLYIDGRYVLSLNETRHRNGYSIGGISPMGFHDHDQLVRGSLLLQAPSWVYHDQIRNLPLIQGASGWDLIQAEWRLLNQQAAPQAAALPAAHEQFLDLLATLVEAGRRIELSATRPAKMIPYRRVDPSAARRRSARSIYKFQLTGNGMVTAGTRVHISRDPDLRGQVRDINDAMITVRFERPVDLDRIPKIDAFVESPAVITFDKQLEAIEVLRDQRSLNPRLLDVLVDRKYRRFQPARGATPRRSLDSTQLTAFRKALAVPDLALVLGPPGTGKTRTIAQIAHACADAKQRVLISSYTNRAVDNALMELPDELRVLRVGREDGVTPGCEHLTLETQASVLQETILRRTEPLTERYAVADPGTGDADGMLKQLTVEVDRLRAAEEEERRITQAFAAKTAELTTAQTARLDRLAKDAAEQQTALTECDRLVTKLTRANERADKAAAFPLLGPLSRGWARRARERLDAAAAEQRRLRQALSAIHRDEEATKAEVARIRDTHPDLSDLRRSSKRAHAKRRATAQEAQRSAGELRGLIADIGGPPPATALDLTSLTGFRDWADQTVALMRRRLALLTEWRNKLTRRTEQLYPELVRYADVIGATCIGSATTGALTGVDFGLAIVDEAGQISTPNVLVPLVRAHRAVLVGDHHQLPPYVEEELRAWASKNYKDNPAVTDLVTKSAFELFFPGTPSGHHEVLRHQRRMPPVVARFVSAQFYNGFLESDVERPHRDDLFASPLAFVDTGGLALRERRDRPPRPEESWANDGYANDLEARIITDLIAYYHPLNPDWAVILPYRAQVGLVTELLTKRLKDEEAVAARVGTVDSFQGGERDTIVFGFTRSNAAGKVGFLNELRRSNVAFSRARQRLVLVGDVSTLIRATDPGFRAMAEALLDHVRIAGDLRDCRELPPAEEAGR